MESTDTPPEFDPPAPEDDPEEGAAGNGSDSTNVDSTYADLPFIFARRTVKADRRALPVYVQDRTAAEVEELEGRLAERFDGDEVMALDVREALLVAGLRHADEAVEVLERWGYGRR